MDHSNKLTLLHKILTEIYDELFQKKVNKEKYTAINWMKRKLIDNENANLLGVPDRLKFLNTPESMEQKSLYILRYLDILMARYKHLHVVCFDRLENLETDIQVSSLDKILEFLVDSSTSMLPISCFRG